MTPEYREAVQADLPGICALGDEVNALHHRAWPQFFAGAGDPLCHQAHWAQSIEADAATTFVAHASHTLVGFVTVSAMDDTHSLRQPMRYGHVGTLSVAAGQRGRGIGRTLMAHAEQWAAARGVTDLRLMVWAFNENALRLYEELGYEKRSFHMGKRLSAPAG